MADDRTTTLVVSRKDPTRAELRRSAQPPLADGQVRFRIDRFSLTANNITYAAFGDLMSYWKFYPTGDDAWGIVPVWGFATAVESKHAGVPVGERFYGYWPMAGDAVLTPDRVRDDGFSESAPHRQELNPVYNRYQRCATDPLYAAGTEDVQAVLRPLYGTSWLIDDFLAEQGFFGATTAMLSSASSKTAYGTAFQLAQRAGLEVIGLTSPGNRAFCEQLGCYTRVAAYDDIESIPADVPCVYIDFSGSAPFRMKLHQRFGNLKYSCAVGGTHVAELGGGKGLPGPRPELFFAPAQAQKRAKEWGAAEFGAKVAAAWRAFSARVVDQKQPWLVIEHHRGEDAVRETYEALASGNVDPRLGHVLSFHA